MKIFRIFFYIFLALLIFIVPIYGAGRIVIPGWLKNHISSSLPIGSELQIGQMHSTSKMGVLYKNIIFKNSDKTIQINLTDLIIEPNLDISKPINFRISSGIIKSKNTEFFVDNLNGKILVSSYGDKDFSILGNLEELKETEKSVFNNVDFLINGIITNQKKITVSAKEIDVKFLSPNGLVKVKLNNLDLTSDFDNDIKTKIEASNLRLDLSNIGRINPNRILIGEKILLTLDLVERNVWQMPIDLKAENIKAISGEIGSKLEIKGIGIWKNATKSCDLYDVLSGKKECGKLIDVVGIGLNLIDTNKKGKFEFSADGFCVTPNAGCQQIIESSIRTKNTAEVISKTMISGVLDPILGGILLGALLSSPDNTEAYDHNARIKVIGNSILLNGKPII